MWTGSEDEQGEKVRILRGEFMKRILQTVSLLSVLPALLLLAPSCARKPKVQQRGDIEQSAVATYVAPGDLDQYYIFYSGGQSGNVYVAGIPSLRHIATIPVFTPYPGTGYGFDKETKAMLGGYTWGDVHHPNISETNGDYDGRWLFVMTTPMTASHALTSVTSKPKRSSGPSPMSPAITALPL